MSITLDPETEAILNRRAARRGLTPEEYLRETFRGRPKSKKSISTNSAPKNLAERLEAVLGAPQLDHVGTSRWSEVEAACDAE